VALTSDDLAAIQGRCDRWRREPPGGDEQVGKDLDALIAYAREAHEAEYFWADWVTKHIDETFEELRQYHQMACADSDLEAIRRRRDEWRKAGSVEEQPLSDLDELIAKVDALQSSPFLQWLGAYLGRAFAAFHELGEVRSDYDAVVGEYHDAIAEIERLTAVLTEIAADPGPIGAIARAALED